MGWIEERRSKDLGISLSYLKCVDKARDIRIEKFQGRLHGAVALNPSDYSLMQDHCKS